MSEAAAKLGGFRATPDQLRQAVRAMARAWAALERQDRLVEMNGDGHHIIVAFGGGQK